MRKILLCIATVILFFSCNQTGKETADKIYFNAKIWTGDSANAWADAIAIKGNEIVYVGKDYQSFKGANTR
jgi:Predicted metal-dependent hydrolase with the TIM-barrel fold